MKEKFALADRVARLEEEGPIDTTSLNLTIASPHVIRQRYGDRLAFAQVTEVEVPASRSIINTLLPNMSTLLARYFDIWTSQEIGHADALGLVMDINGLERLPERQSISHIMEIAGRFARISSGFHDTIEFSLMVYSGIGEDETTRYYGRLGHELREDGEMSLATLMTRIAHQEASHREFFRDYALKKRQHLRPLQVWTAQQFTELFYRPVGTHKGRKDANRRQLFGKVVRDTVGEGEGVERFAEPIERFAHNLLNVAGDDLKPFVRKRYEQLIEEYKAVSA